MKLPLYETTLQQNLDEFDVWITPSLGEVRDINGFEHILTNIVEGFDAIAEVTDEFKTEVHCHPHQMGNGLQKAIAGLSSSETTLLLHRVISVLYLVTGKSDNNVKCQFPSFLVNRLGKSQIPTASKDGTLRFTGVPRVFGEDRLVSVLVGLSRHPEHQSAIFQHFIEFILSDDRYISQLWAIGNSYVCMSKIGKERDLLTSLAVFQARGSISAKGGHTPERLLRQRLAEWGCDLD